MGEGVSWALCIMPARVEGKGGCQLHPVLCPCWLGHSLKPQAVLQCEGHTTHKRSSVYLAHTAHASLSLSPMKHVHVHILIKHTRSHKHTRTCRVRRSKGAVCGEVQPLFAAELQQPPIAEVGVALALECAQGGGGVHDDLVGPLHRASFSGGGTLDARVCPVLSAGHAFDVCRRSGSAGSKAHHGPPRRALPPPCCLSPAAHPPRCRPAPPRCRPAPPASGCCLSPAAHPPAPPASGCAPGPGCRPASSLKSLTHRWSARGPARREGSPGMRAGAKGRLPQLMSILITCSAPRRATSSGRPWLQGRRAEPPSPSAHRPCLVPKLAPASAGTTQ